MINGYEFVTNTSLSLAEKYITWILFNYYAATSNVCSEKKYTKHSSNSLLRLVYFFFSERTLLSTYVENENINLTSWFKMGRNHIRCGIPTLVAFLTM